MKGVLILHNRKYVRIALAVFIGFLSIFLLTNAITTLTVENTECDIDSAWAYGNDNATPFTDLGFKNWGWSNGPYGEGIYTLDIYADEERNILENGIIVGEAIITYINGNVEVECKIFDDLFTLEKVHLWVGETELPSVRCGKKVKPTNALRQLRHDLNREYSDFEGKRHYLKDEKGWIMLDNWYSTCFPCFELMKMIYDNYSEFERRGIKVLSVNSVEKPSPHLKSYCDSQKIKMDHVLFSQKNNKLFSVLSPTIVLINPEKQIIFRENNLPHDIESFLKILDEVIIKK